MPTCMGLQPAGFAALPPTEAATLTRTAAGDLAVWTRDRVLTIPMAGGDVREVPLRPGPPCSWYSCEVQVRALAGENCRRVPPAPFVELRTDDGTLMWGHDLAADWTAATAAPDGQGNCGLVDRHQPNLRVLGRDGHKDLALPTIAWDPTTGTSGKIQWLSAAADLHGGWWVAGHMGKFVEYGWRAVIGHVSAQGATTMLPREPKGGFGVLHLDLEANPRGVWLVVVAQGSTETEQGVAEFLVRDADAIHQRGPFWQWSQGSPGGALISSRERLSAVRQPLLDRLGLLRTASSGGPSSESRGVDRVLVPEGSASHRLGNWPWPPAEIRGFYYFIDKIKRDRAPCGWPDAFYLPHLQAVDLPGGGMALLARTSTEEQVPGLPEVISGQLVLFRFAATGPCAGTCGDGQCRADEQEWCWGDCSAR